MPFIFLVNIECVPAITEVVSVTHLRMRPCGEIDVKPVASVCVLWPRWELLLTAELSLVALCIGIPAVGKPAPVTHDLVGQHLLLSCEGEVSHAEGVEHERQLRAVAHVVIAEGHVTPNSAVRGEVVEHVQPHSAPVFHSRAGRFAGRAQEDVVSHRLQ